MGDPVIHVFDSVGNKVGTSGRTLSFTYLTVLVTKQELMGDPVIHVFDSVGNQVGTSGRTLSFTYLTVLVTRQELMGDPVIHVFDSFEEKNNIIGSINKSY